MSTRKEKDVFHQYKPKVVGEERRDQAGWKPHNVSARLNSQV